MEVMVMVMEQGMKGEGKRGHWFRGNSFGWFVENGNGMESQLCSKISIPNLKLLYYLIL